MRSEINITILTPGFTPGVEDTITISSLQLYLKALKDKFPEAAIRVLAFQFPARKGSYIWNGIPVYSAGGKGLKINRILTWFRVLHHLYSLRKQNKVDIVHAFWLTEAALIGLVFGGLTGIPVLTTAMGRDVKKENRYLPLISLFKPKTTLISEFQRTFLARRNAIRIVGIIPFGVDPGYYRELSTVRTTDILGVGSLNQVKNYPEFLKIIIEVARQFPEVRCRIIGEGPDHEAVKEMILKKKLEKRVVLLGNLDYGVVQDEMSRAKVLLHTSSFEGQGLVITEGLAAGLYVVCHQVGIAATIVSPRLMTGATSHELAGLVCAVLSMDHPDNSSRIYLKIDETCRDYLILYRSLQNKTGL